MSDTRKPNTKELLSLIRGGDRTVADQLLQLFRPRLRRMVAARMDGRVISRVDPSDVVQEALIVAHRRLPEYLEQVDSPFYPWLRQIAWDRLVEAHRQHILAEKRTVRREESMELSEASALQLIEQMPTDATSPSGHVTRKELRHRIRAILNGLPDMDREILILKHLEELSNSECAAVLGLTVVTVKKRYLRALGRMRLAMDDGIRG